MAAYAKIGWVFSKEPFEAAGNLPYLVWYTLLEWTHHEVAQ